MSQDLPVLITSVFSLANGHVDTAASSQTRQPDTQNGTDGQLSNQCLSACYSVVNQSTENLSIPLKHVNVSRTVVHSPDYGDGRLPWIFPAAESLVSPPSRVESNSNITCSVAVRMCDGPTSCPSFCCRKNNALVKTLRAKSNQNSAPVKQQELNGITPDDYARQSTVFSGGLINSTNCPDVAIELQSSELKHVSTIDGSLDLACGTHGQGTGSGTSNTTGTEIKRELQDT